jgi:hypothetical protein
MGVPLMRGSHDVKMTAAQRATAVELYRMGWNMQRIADHFGVTRSNIWLMLKRRGVQTRPRHWTRRGKYRVRTLDSATREQRDNDGIIVTLHEQQSGAIHVAHVPGMRQDALKQVAAWCDTHEDDWRLLSYSTPATIERDLQGARTIEMRGNGMQSIDNPEARALSSIDRLDLLDPSLNHLRAGRRR